MIYQELIDLDSMIDMVDGVTFINETIPASESDLEGILNKTTTVYDNRDNNDQISLLPKCQCGYLHFRGAELWTCPQCNTKPVALVDAMVKSNVWFRKPEGIERLINPFVYHMLHRRFISSGWEAISWLTDPHYKCSNKVPTWMNHLQAAGFERGWNYFIRNFDEILAFLLRFKEFQIPKGEVDYLFLLIEKEREKVFCNFLPLPSPAMFPYEKTNFCIYRSDSSRLAASFVQAMISIDSPIQNLSQRSRESRVSKMYRAIVEFQHNHIRNEISPKEGEIRRHHMGTKTTLSGRAIIISKTGPQDHQEVGIPWFMALGSLRPIFINKLTKRGFTLNDAILYLRTHTARYSPLLKEIMDEMKAESVDENIWIMHDRNPSLVHGSIQTGPLYWKTDPSDKCISFPIADVKSNNADFDGDQITVMFILDGKLVRMVDTFLPWTNTFELTKPFKMSKNVFVSDPQVSCYSNYLRVARERRLNRHTP